MRACRKSTIVVLPTGSGKTLIATATAASSTAASGQPTLFLVPTRLLVEQQARAVRNESRLRIAEYQGSASTPTPSSFDVLVSTPAAFLSLSTLDRNFQLAEFGLIIFDEVHHAVKKHPYRKVSRKLALVPEAERPRVLGLTASLTYATNASTHPSTLAGP
jgi:endoribonuclease Dicer